MFPLFHLVIEYFLFPLFRPYISRLFRVFPFRLRGTSCSAFQIREHGNMGNMTYNKGASVVLNLYPLPFLPPER